MKFKSNLQIVLTIFMEIALTSTVISLIFIAATRIMYYYLPYDSIEHLSYVAFKIAITSMYLTVVLLFSCIAVEPAPPEKR